MASLTLRLAIVTALLSAGCALAHKPPGEAAPQPAKEGPKMDAKAKVALPAELEAELDSIRHAPAEAIGFGDKAYVPWEPNTGERLIASDDPQVTARLRAEALGDGDRVYRLAVLHILGRRTAGPIDDALIAALEDPALRATAAYLLGRSGFKGYPARPRSPDAVRAALRRHLEDPGTFEDPFYRQTFRTGDFVLGAYVRLTGPANYHIADPTLRELIGYSLPRFAGEVRSDLLARARKG